MAAPITEHELIPEPEDDPSHPIPYLGALDVMTVMNDGGADLVIVVAAPLMADKRSQTRLLDKIESYLDFIGSDTFRAEVGQPDPAHTNLVVKLHPDSAPEIRALLARSESWVQGGAASLRVEDLTQSELGQFSA